MGDTGTSVSSARVWLCFACVAFLLSCLLLPISFVPEIRVLDKPELSLVTQSHISDCLRPHELWPAKLLCPRGFSRIEYWSGLSCPPPGDLPDPGIEPRSPALQADSLPSEPPGKTDK